MKKTIAILFSIPLLIFSNACKDPCKDMECLNGGECVEIDRKTAECNCTTGYEGDDCGTEMRAKFLSMYAAKETCDQTGNGTYTATISESSGSVSEIKITGAWGMFANGVIATVDGKDISIASQDPDNNNNLIVGSGTMSNDQTMVSVTYTITDSSSAVNNCSSVWTKQ
ncbi:MAG: calcium-binding EGF-like domain-containing protein [Flavobacteriales bacterium]